MIGIEHITAERIRQIVAERIRQIVAEGYTAEHDAQHKNGELACAAACYADYASHQMQGKKAHFCSVPPILWPWAKESWKPSYNPMRNLEKAGALIAAEIDRLAHLKGEE